MLKCTPADLEAMSLYRTNSDRGLWKKYRSEQPKHFHKPCYIGKEQEKTQVLKKGLCSMITGMSVFSEENSEENH